MAFVPSNGIDTLILAIGKPKPNDKKAKKLTFSNGLSCRILVSYNYQKKMKLERAHVYIFFSFQMSFLRFSHKYEQMVNVGLL